MLDRVTRLHTAFALGLVFSTLIAASAWTFVKTRDVRSIEVTGSAKKSIESDLIEWTAGLSADDKDSTAAYRTLKSHVDKTLAYLKSQGLSDKELRTSSTTSEELYETSTVGSGDERVEKSEKVGVRMHQSVLVQSHDVAKVERISREVTALLEQGVPVRSDVPRYLYTKLSEVKIAMLAEASKDARTRAEQMVSAAGGGNVGALLGADMGVINVNPANSTDTSWQGNNDTSSFEKDIITIVHCTFELE